MDHMGAPCTQARSHWSSWERWSHVRDVPDEVHDKLTGLAGGQGLSLSAFMRREMEHMARRADTAQRNAEVLRAARKLVLGRP